MTRIFVDAQEMTFNSMEEIKDFFGLDEIDEEDMASIEGMHVCIDPYVAEIHDCRRLMWEETDEKLDEKYQDRRDDI